MSFDYNPYNHIEVIHRPHGNVQLHCHACGRTWGDWTTTVPVAFLFGHMHAHVRDSHKRTRADFEGWPDE